MYSVTYKNHLLDWKYINIAIFFFYFFFFHRRKNSSETSHRCAVRCLCTISADENLLRLRFFSQHGLSYFLFLRKEMIKRGLILILNFNLYEGSRAYLVCATWCAIRTFIILVRFTKILIHLRRRTVSTHRNDIRLALFRECGEEESRKTRETYIRTRTYTQPEQQRTKVKERARESRLTKLQFFNSNHIIQRSKSRDKDRKQRQKKTMGVLHIMTIIYVILYTQYSYIHNAVCVCV